MNKRLLDEKEAFLAMTKFLIKWNDLVHSEDINTLLAGMDLDVWGNGKTLEPGIWDDWIEAIDTTLREKNKEHKDAQ